MDAPNSGGFRLAAIRSRLGAKQRRALLEVFVAWKYSPCSMALSSCRSSPPLVEALQACGERSEWRMSQDEPEFKHLGHKGPIAGVQGPSP